MPKKLVRKKPGPAPHKVNPKKKTYKLEQQAIDRLAILAEIDGRSASAVLEAMVYEAWDALEAYRRAEKQAIAEGKPVPASPIKPMTVGKRAKMALAVLKKS